MPNLNTTRLSLVGDVMIEGESVTKRLQNNFGFQRAVEDFNKAQSRFINLEMPLSDRGYRVPKHSNIRSRPEVIRDVGALGSHAASLANNHMMDFGPDAMRDTLKACADAGLMTTGAGEDIDEAMKPVIVHSEDCTIGLLSFASTLPVESDAGVGKPGIAPIRVGFSFEFDSNLMVEQPGTMPVVRSWSTDEDTARAVSAVQELRSQVDVVVVALHWGVPDYWLSPYQGLLAEYQQPLGRTLIDAGADIIWGHHSHTLHPIEVYKGKPILYGLGNFIFEKPRVFMKPESVIVHVVNVDPLEIELSPILVDDDGFPVLVKGDRAVHVLERLEEVSTQFGTKFVLQEDRIKINLDEENVSNIK